MALLRWLEAGHGELARPALVSDREGEFSERVGKADSRGYVGPEIVEAPAEVLDEGMAGTTTLAVRSRFSPRIGRSRALRRPWSVSIGLLAWTSVPWNAAGRSSSSRGG